MVQIKAPPRKDSFITPIQEFGEYTAAQTDTILWNPATTKKFVITDIIITTDTAGTVHLEDGTTKIFEFFFADNGGCCINLQTPYVSTTANNNLTFTSDIAGNHNVHILGYEI